LATIPWLFDSPPLESSRRVIFWWELRRIPYNLFIGVTAAVNLFIIIYFGSKHVEPGEDVIEPVLLLVAGPAFFVGANLCYSAGWFLELFARRYGTTFTPVLRARLLQLGFVFSAIVITLPLFLMFLLATVLRVTGH
jgi:hypothetical protein